MKTLKDVKTNEIFTVSDKEAARVLPTGRYEEVVEEKASAVAPGAVSTAGELAAPSGADTAAVEPVAEEPAEPVATEEPVEEAKKGRKR
jgi:hypothetical protein